MLVRCNCMGINTTEYGLQQECRMRSFCLRFAGFSQGFSEGDEAGSADMPLNARAALSLAPRTPREPRSPRDSSLNSLLGVLGFLGELGAKQSADFLTGRGSPICYGNPVRLPMPNWLPQRTGLPLAKSISITFSLPTWPPCSSVSSPMIFLVAVSTMSPLEG